MSIPLWFMPRKELWNENISFRPRTKVKKVSVRLGSGSTCNWHQNAPVKMFALFSICIRRRPTTCHDTSQSHRLSDPVCPRPRSTAKGPSRRQSLRLNQSQSPTPFPESDVLSGRLRLCPGDCATLSLALWVDPNFY